MGKGSFFAELCAENADIHHAGLAHPMVRGIGAGSLPEETFRFYIEQDYRYLTRYIRVIAQGIAASPDMASATKMAELVHVILSIEIDALEDLYQEFGGDRAHLDEVVAAPTCQAYTDHLLASAASGDLFLILAAMLPCQWGYREIGRGLKAEGLPDDPRFARWISEYASDEYGTVVDWMLERFDELAAEASPAERERARAIFALSTRYELGFWEMAWTRQQWPQVAVAATA